MLRIGLTGGIGSGKTTVAQAFEVLGIPVYFADLEARRIMNEDPDLRKAIISQFGEKSYEQNQLNREYISSIVFNDSYKLDLLNSLVHPATLKDADRWMRKQTGSYAIKEAALLFEAGAAEHLDYIIGVFAPLELRLQRVMARDRVSKEEVEKRMRNQLVDEIKMKLCDFVIVNDEEQLLTPQVLELHEKFLSVAANPSFSS